MAVTLKKTAEAGDAQPMINGKPITFAKTADILAYAKTGKAERGEALKELDRRIAKRNTDGKGLIPSIVEARNELAKEEGLTAIPVPVYPTKALPTKDVKALAKMIKDAGIDAGALITELAS